MGKNIRFALAPQVFFFSFRIIKIQLPRNRNFLCPKKLMWLKASFCGLHCMKFHQPGGHQDLAGHLLLPRPIRPLRGPGRECGAEPRRLHAHLATRGGGWPDPWRAVIGHIWGQLVEHLWRRLWKILAKQMVGILTNHTFGIWRSQQTKHLGCKQTHIVVWPPNFGCLTKAGH